MSFPSQRLGPRSTPGSPGLSAQRLISVGLGKRVLEPEVFLGKCLSQVCFSGALEMLNRSLLVPGPLAEMPARSPLTWPPKADS